jgi:hypothetical protein
VGGTVTGLASGAALTLQNNGSDTKTISANGSFSFKTQLKQNDKYEATVSVQPIGQVCTVQSGSGTVNDSAVNNIAVNCQSFVSQWVDGFETYAQNEFPATNWSSSGNNQVYATGLVSRTGSQSLFTYGIIDANWAALAHRQFIWSPKLKFSFAVFNGDETLSGPHHFHGSIQLNIGPSWQTTGRGLIFFSSDGRVYATQFDDNNVSGQVLTTFSSGRWYDVTILYDASQTGAVTLTYFIDGRQVATYNYPQISDEGSLVYLAVSSGGGSTWFDNVEVSTGM